MPPTLAMVLPNPNPVCLRGADGGWGRGGGVGPPPCGAVCGGGVGGWGYLMGVG